MNNLHPLSDAEARHIAETTFDRNVVVLAGAGTGKTTLLVNRLLHALLREPHPFRLTEMLALTFTNKAANEMKGRLHEELQQLLRACQSMSLTGEAETVRLKKFQAQYGLSTDHIKEKVTIALHDLEKAHIATLHSFAAHVLRLFPLESGVDPNFQEDDGTQFSEIFSNAWNMWLDEALSEQGSNHIQWQKILDVVDLKGIRNFASALCDDLVSLPALKTQLDSDGHSPALKAWLHTNQQRISHLLQHYTHAKPRKIERMLEVAEHVFHLVEREGWSGAGELSNEEKVLLSSTIGQAPKGWTPDNFQEARRVVQGAHRLLKVDERFLSRVVHLLEPFVQRVRRMYADKGWIRFDGLLVRVRDVLRDHPMVREQLKTDFQAIMVDEFQDTDPLQYEILLYLGERLGDHCQQWDAIRLIPGKLFIVGDPKQSIYAFRRADIQAFDQVVAKLTQDGGVVCTLTTNFRSDRAVLEVVNAVFDRLFAHEDNVQPPNVPLMVGRHEEEVLITPGVELYVVANAGEEEWDAERATRIEAEWLAAWIHDQVNSGTQWVVENGIRIPLCPGHVAVLLRKFTNAHVYLEAMHRWGIPCLTDGERHFYRRQEVIDMVNVLRVLDDPTDAIAVVGILRSSLGGVPDQDIMALLRLGPLDIRRSDTWQEWDSTRKPVIEILFEQLAVLHAQAKRMPIPEFIDRVFAQLPIVELAAASSHGEQAVMNIWKLRDLMAAQAALPHLSFSGWVDRLVECLMTHSPEPEASLAEETLDAVRVLSIHKAKGLEFPVVMLPGLHQQSAGPDRGAEVSVDWMSEVYGCSFPPIWNAGQVLLWEKERIREKAEQRRVLYVGMTRARDRLILSGGLLTKSIRESFLGFLQQVADGAIGNPEHDMVKIGPAAIRQTVVMSSRVPSQKMARSLSEPNDSLFMGERPISVEMDRERESAWQHASRHVAFVTPSSQHPSQTIRSPHTRRGGSTLASPYLGTLVHRLLEQWNFQLDPENFREPLKEFFRQDLRGDLEDDEKKAVVLDIEELMETFLQSPPYRELQHATIIGREVPFVMPWPSEEQSGSVSRPYVACVMEGVMDVVYEVAGEVWVGDYKTDMVTASTVVGYAERYRQQAQAYAIAASESLGVAVRGCKFFFLRIGEMVTIMRDVA